jgi:sugar lactone lactonase YvrE
LAIAGDNCQENKLNQLCHPESMYIDDDQNLYIADSLNHRIVKWKPNGKKWSMGSRWKWMSRKSNKLIKYANGCNY